MKKLMTKTEIKSLFSLWGVEVKLPKKEEELKIEIPVGTPDYSTCIITKSDVTNFSNKQLYWVLLT